uniref:Uncharacterized protein n=1 Tax=Lepeophtheirus salmonis TaxID=72036 RepID=A0A0K2TS32_LEPSM
MPVLKLMFRVRMCLRPVPEVLIHSLGDQLLAHSTVLGQPGQGSPQRSLDGLPEAFKEAGSSDLITSHVVGLAADIPLNLPALKTRYTVVLG